MLIGVAVGWAALLQTMALMKKWRGNPKVSQGEVRFALAACWVWLPIQIGLTLYVLWHWLSA